VTILLLGANGQLGHTFMADGGLASRDALVAATREGTLNGVACERADLSEPASLLPLLDRIAPSIIVNAAAYTAVDRAEQEEALATRINGEAVGAIGQWAASHGALVVHYSTDYVFDGASNTPYPTDAGTGPLGAYGRSKLAGEQALMASGAAHLLMRTAWVYAPHGKNFLLTMLRLGSEREELRVVADQVGAPTSTGLIVRATLAAIDRWRASDAASRKVLEGTHHLVASGTTSWHGFATAIFEKAQRLGVIAKAPHTVAIRTAEFPTPAPRPAFSVLDNRGFIEAFDTPLPHWETELDRVMMQLDHPRK
jgi:dTDP-4-dehydrorhamnose reductase